MTITHRNYEPNDSEFGEAYRTWCEHARVDSEPVTTLSGYTLNMLDEFSSVAAMLINTPIYAEDRALRRFASDIEDAIRWLGDIARML